MQNDTLVFPKVIEVAVNFSGT